MSARDWIELAGFVGVVIGYIVSVTMYIANSRSATKILAGRLEVVDASLEDFKKEMKKMTEVITNQKIYEERLLHIDQRMLAQGRRVDRIEQALFKIPPPSERP